MNLASVNGDGITFYAGGVDGASVDDNVFFGINTIIISLGEDITAIYVNAFIC